MEINEDTALARPECHETGTTIVNHLVIANSAERRRNWIFQQILKKRTDVWKLCDGFVDYDEISPYPVEVAVANEYEWVSYPSLSYPAASNQTLFDLQWVRIRFVLLLLRLLLLLLLEMTWLGTKHEAKLQNKSNKMHRHDIIINKLYALTIFGIVC
jgi:hypothetical protein